MASKHIRYSLTVELTVDYDTSNHTILQPRRQELVYEFPKELALLAIENCVFVKRWMSRRQWGDDSGFFEASVGKRRTKWSRMFGDHGLRCLDRFDYLVEEL
ncbi:hypothetical protein GOBAR_DD14415 [Gossypium barbadense]|nr:hypothetical protein GOBAR_DD14415 [Gossypium barbadense]